MENKSIIKNIGYNSIKTASTLIFPVLTFAYASRKLYASGMGSIEYSKSWVAYFTLIAMLGVVNYGTRECAKVRDNRCKLSNLASEILTVNLLSTIIAYVLFYLMIFNIQRFEPYRLLLVINSISMLFTVIGMEWLFNAVEDYKYITIRTCIVQIVSFVCMIIFVRGMQDVWKYALIQVFAAGGANFFNLWYSKKYVDITLCFENISIAIKKHLKPLIILFLMVLSVQVFTHMDSTMLGWITGDKAVGYYSAATKVTAMMASVLVSSTIVLMPRIAYYEEKDGFEEIKKLVAKTINIIMLISIPMAVGIIFISDFLILILSGASYEPATLTTRILAIRVILSPLNAFIITHLFVAIRKENKMLIATIVAAVVNLISNFILIPKLAQNGAAIATIVSEFVELLIVLFFLREAVSIRRIFRGTWQYLLGSAIIPVLFLCLSAIEISIYVKSLLLIVLSVPMYFMILRILKNQYYIAAKLIIMGKLRGTKNG